MLFPGRSDKLKYYSPALECVIEKKDELYACLLVPNKKRIRQELEKQFDEDLIVSSIQLILLFLMFVFKLEIMAVHCILCKYFSYIYTVSFLPCDRY